jgi:phenylacetate-coenzyme A ligase PaaK-like adenylate-forming protein
MLAACETADELSELETRLKENRFCRPQALTEQERIDNRIRFQTKLLRETIAYDVDNVPYYSNRWRELGLNAASFESISDLARWPIIRKADIVLHSEELVSRSVRSTSFRCTSGTTGKRLIMPVSTEELEALDRLGRLRALASEATPAHPVVLQVMAPVRRLATASFGLGYGAVLTTFLNLDAPDHRFEFDYIDHISQCLLEPFPTEQGPRQVEILWICPTFLVRTLTDCLIRRQFDCASLKLKGIVCSGGIVTQELADYVARHWNAPLLGFYSLTEIAGAHPRCPNSGVYDFNVVAFAEILDIQTQLPVADGEEGVLVLTSLYPFQQARPMFRYWTGDVFTRVSGRADIPLSGIFRGREQECVDVGRVLPEGCRPRLLGSADVLEALHQHGEVPQFHKNPKYRLWVLPGDDAPVKLEVEAFPISPSRAARLRDSIAHKLVQRLSARNGGPIPPSRVDVRLLERGALASMATRYYPDR